MTEETKLTKLNDTADSTAQFDPKDIEQNRVMAMLAYLGLLVFVPLFAAKESKFARFHAAQGLTLLLTGMIWACVHYVIMLVFGLVLLPGAWRIHSMIGSLLGLVWLVFAVLAIVGIVNALSGKAKELPVIGKYKLLN